ncbi:hypothetical protein [Variovorax sp. OV700]|uniref:hypothetical protein n=1 Tax=Variovorax sp. OV700 TaxID=1882826 RepID=UPI000881BC88|nr:hypothetical protein [Variovorax sp. OV700]SDH94038.1 hypothetical protein SAMN05444748_10327 [Variovorax sp. OV700]
MLIKIVLTLLGTALGLMCAFVALVLGGMGEGWTAAWPFGFMALILFPAAFYSLANHKRWPRFGSLGMLGLGVVLDLALYSMTVSQGIKFFEREASAGWAWIGLWSVWQIAFLAAACLAPARPSPV